AGEYRIERSLGVVEIIDYLVAGRAEAHRFVIPEGLTLEQVTNLLVDQRLGTRERFVRAMHRRPARYGLNLRVGRDNLEGYLMPDTYRFASGLTEREIVEALVQNWKRKVWTPNEKAFQASERSVDEIVVMASLIEREARVPEDRPRIASVINNRLEQSMLLQIDATVLYALGKHKSRVTFNDLKVKSPYNTYRRKGLPPGPICSPGLASIQAVLTPDITDYYYYVAQPDGRHVFTRTAGEHGAAIARLQKAARNTHAAPTGR
ncbi:MAG: endolytic transglycosylase MltG, partial [Armatimonadetes bacterium]|nr:endolytic transglycosylase MltG [Armatimonadota bacterium]